MNIDISLLYSNVLETIDITDSYKIPKNIYEDTDIKDLSDINVDGYIYLNENDEASIKCSIKGSMTILDSISLDNVEYPFTIEYDDIIPENAKKNENILDIFEFLWENTVLEVPLQFTKVDDLSKFHGDGWKLISEEELKETNNPFSDLLKDYDKE